MDMKHVKYLALVLCIGNLSPVMAQTASKSLTVDNLVAWQRISGQAISMSVFIFLLNLGGKGNIFP